MSLPRDKPTVIDELRSLLPDIYKPDKIEEFALEVLILKRIKILEGWISEMQTTITLLHYKSNVNREHCDNSTDARDRRLDAIERRLDPHGRSDY